MTILAVPVLVPVGPSGSRTIIGRGDRRVADGERSFAASCIESLRFMTTKPSIKDLKSGQADAWRWFVSEFSGPINGYARRMGHPDPDEVAGATFETVARRIGTFEGGHREFRSFVFSIAHARIVDELRRQSVRAASDVRFVESATDDPAAITEVDERLARAMTHLSEEQRHLLHLRYTVGLSTRETSRAVGKSEVATRVALSRTMSRLRDLMTEGNP